VNVQRQIEAKPSEPAQEPPFSRSIHDLIIRSLDQDKAEDIISIDLAGKSSLADYMIIATGRSTRQVAAMAEHLRERLKEAGGGKCQVEGLPQADWVLIDAGDVIAHLFRPEVRAFYNLEKMWAANLKDETA
jgi:ribosome-associated protein